MGSAQFGQITKQLATNQGAFQGIPPTGKQVAVPGGVFYRSAGGKVAEFRGQFDCMSQMQQLAVVQRPEAPTP